MRGRLTLEDLAMGRRASLGAVTGYSYNGERLALDVVVARRRSRQSIRRRLAHERPSRTGSIVAGTDGTAPNDECLVARGVLSVLWDRSRRSLISTRARHYHARGGGESRDSDSRVGQIEGVRSSPCAQSGSRGQGQGRAPGSEGDCHRPSAGRPRRRGRTGLT